MIWMDMLYRALINMAVTALFPRKDYIGPLVLTGAYERCGAHKLLVLITIAKGL